MAIQIPKINRNEQASPFQSAGRAELSVPDLAASAADMTKAISKVGDATFDAVVDYQDKKHKKLLEAEDIKVKSIISNYELESGKPVADFTAKQTGTDLTEDYVTTANTIKELKSKFLNSEESQSLSEKSRAKLDQALQDRNNLNDLKIYTKFTASNVELGEIKKKEGLERLKSDMITVSPLIDPKDPKSFGLLDERLAIFDKEANDPASNIKSSDVQKAKAEGIKNVIQNLASVGDIEKADAVLKKYQGLIDPDSLPAVTRYVTKLKTEKEIADTVRDAKLKPDEERAKILAQVTDGAKKDKIEKGLYSEDIRMQQTKAKVQKRTYETVASQLINDQLKGKNFRDADDIINNPKVAAVWDQLNPQQKKGLLSFAHRPKESNIQELEDLNKMYQNNEMTKWSPSEFQEKTANLSTKDFNTLQKKYISDRTDPKHVQGLIPRERKDVLMQVKSNLKGTLLTTTEGGVLTPAATKYWYSEIEDELQLEFDKMDKSFKTSEEKNKAIKDLTLKIITKFKGMEKKSSSIMSSIGDFFGGAKQKPQQPASTSAPKIDVDKQREELRKKFGK